MNNTDAYDNARLFNYQLDLLDHQRTITIPNNIIRAAGITIDVMSTVVDIGITSNGRASDQWLSLPTLSVALTRHKYLPAAKSSCGVRVYSELVMPFLLTTSGEKLLFVAI